MQLRYMYKYINLYTYNTYKIHIHIYNMRENIKICLQNHIYLWKDICFLPEYTYVNNTYRQQTVFTNSDTLLLLSGSIKLKNYIL